MKSIIIKKFNNYRQLLEALYKYEYEASKEILTRKAFAEKIGLTDSNLRMIISGKRKLSSKLATKICQKLKLNRDDSEYFLSLIFKENIKSFHKLNYLNTESGSSSSNKTDKLVSTSNQEVLLDSTLQAILIYINACNINLKDEKVASEHLAKKFKISLSEIKKIMKDILELQAQIEDSKNFHIIFSKLTNNFKRDEFFRKEFLNAAYDVKKIKNSNYYFSTKIFSLSQDKLSEFAQEYKQLAEKYMIDEDVIYKSKNEKAIVRALFHLAPIVTFNIDSVINCNV